MAKNEMAKKVSRLPGYGRRPLGAQPPDPPASAQGPIRSAGTGSRMSSTKPISPSTVSGSVRVADAFIVVVSGMLCFEDGGRKECLG